MPKAEDLQPWLKMIDHNRQYTNFGPLTGKLEEQLRDLVHADHAVTVSSGTLGLELALTALQIDIGSRVLVPSLTFPATAAAIIRAGLVPVFGDVDEQSLVMTPEIARHVCSQVKIGAVLTVSIHGAVHDPDEWDTFTEDTSIPVLIDAAGVIGRQKVGKTTSVIYSLHATKPLAAGEGGFVATQDHELSSRIRSLSNFGFRKGRVQSVGTNAKMSEYHAAVGLAALSCWPETVDRWTGLYDTYFRALKNHNLRHTLLLATKRAATSNLCLRYERTITEIHIQALNEIGIETRRWYWPPLHRHPAFDGFSVATDLSVTNRVSDRIIGIPFHLSLNCGDVDRVCEALYDVFVRANI